MDELFGFVGFIVFGGGLYSLYAYISMKKTGHINETILLGNSYTEQKCKDKEAFLKKALPAVLVFALVTTIYGVIDIINYFVTPLGMADTIGMVIFLVVLVWFLYYTTKLKKEFF